MKLTENRGARDRKPRSADVLGKEQEVSSLRERLGLPKQVEAKLRQFLVSEKNDYWAGWLQQVEVAALLISLFPEEAEKIRNQTPIEKLVNYLPNIRPPEDGIGMKNIKLVSPDQPLTIPERLFQNDLFSGPASLWDELIKLSTAAEVAILFPDRKTDNKKQAQRLFTEQTKGRRVSVDLLDGLFYLLHLDPTLHTQIHEFVKSHADEFESMFDIIRTQGTDMAATVVVGRYFTAYKLLLADEIKQLPSGLLVAVERSGVGRAAPLPERNVA